jgi:hypothetical protein
MDINDIYLPLAPHKDNILTDMNILVKYAGEANQTITTAKVGGFLRIIKNAVASW